MTQPVGVLPRPFWIVQRIVEIVKAIRAYVLDGYPVPVEWLDELATLVGEYNCDVDEAS
jgi:hypothetical protein